VANGRRDFMLNSGAIYAVGGEKPKKPKTEGRVGDVLKPSLCERIET
jgi:hypothetical protein